MTKKLHGVHHPPSWRGHMRSFWEILSFLRSKKHAHSNFIQFHLVNLCTTGNLPYGKNPHPNRASCVKDIGSYIWLPNFGNTWNYRPNTSNANRTTNHTCLEYEVFISYFDPHDGGVHFTPIDTFHPHRLPPSGLQTPLNTRWWPILSCMSIKGSRPTLKTP